MTSSFDWTKHRSDSALGCVGIETKGQLFGAPCEIQFTMVSIWLVPPIVQAVGWRWAFGVLALGPVFGVAAMARLRGLHEAALGQTSCALTRTGLCRLADISASHSNRGP